jgi:hypothetical protein
VAQERWLVDWDSVCGNLQVAQIRSVNERFSTNYQLGDVNDWNWWFENTPKEQCDFVWGPECFKSREWTLNIPPLPGAIDGIRILQNWWKVDPVVVSDRKPYMAEWLAAWFKKHDLYLPIVTSDWSFCPKMEVAAELGLTTVVEDAPHHAMEMGDSGKFDVVYLMTQPWNAVVKEEGSIVRVRDWTDLITTEVRDRAWRGAA